MSPKLLDLRVSGCGKTTVASSLDPF